MKLLLALAITLLCNFLAAEDWEALKGAFKIQGDSIDLKYTNNDFLSSEKAMELPFKLPDSYRKYCNTFGPGTMHFGGIELFISVPCDSNENINVASYSKKAKGITDYHLKNSHNIKDENITLAKRLIPFGSLDSAYLCWDPSEIDASGEPAIYLINYENYAGDFTKVATNIYALISAIGIQGKFGGIYEKTQGDFELKFVGIKRNVKP